VGRNLSELETMRGLIARALARTLLLSFAVGVGGGLVFSRIMRRRLDQINRNSVAILHGDVGRRMPVTGSGDEFDRLAGNLNRMLDRIQSLMRGMREVTENIAHDLRKPISRLRSRIEVTLLGEPDRDAYREALESTVEETEQILSLFNALLTIAMAEARITRENFADVDLMEIARSAVEVYAPAAEEAGFDLELEGPERAPCRGNPQLLSQAAANLLDNAVKHVPGGGELRVAVDVSGDEVTLVVADRGPGIPESYRAEALERFSRLEKSRTTPGSGLGLSLVRAVAALHGGSVALEGNRPGLRVVLRLPAEPPEGTTLPPADGARS
jgi:signal transduction histidine kinase